MSRLPGPSIACLAALLTSLGLAVACSPKPPAPPAQVTQAEPQAPPPPVEADPRLSEINMAAFEAAPPATSPPAISPPAVSPPAATPRDPSASASPAAKPAYDPVLVRAEVLLDRARFSPGVIDGKDGENLRKALTAFQAARGLPGNGALNDQTWQALTADAAPVVADYTLTEADVSGPFSPDTGEDFIKMAELPAQNYVTAVEALAERFHMDQALLSALNPGVDFTQPGVSIVVAQPGGAPLGKGEVDHIEVSKSRMEVTAFGKDGAVLAAYPATVGSRERPSPTGTHKVKGVSRNPTYVYDPAKLTWGPRSKGKLTISPGPNNPVGLVWIDLDAPSYGLHGAPDPNTIGKTASHGCVRLTNWDAQALADGVQAGVKVTFVS